MPQILIFLALALLFIFGFTAFTGAPYVPSKKSDIEKAFTKLYPLSPKDTLIDFGAGDGIVLKIAAKRGAKIIGLELNPLLALLAKLRTKSAIYCINYYHYRLPPETTVIYTFADSRDLPKIYNRIRQEATRLDKSLYLISLAFDLPDHKPIKTISPYYLYKISPQKSPKGNYSNNYLKNQSKARAHTLG